MKLFIAGQGVPAQDIYNFRLEQKKKGKEIAFLHSYLEIKGGKYDLLNKHLSPENRFLDSGAFTAFTQGKVIDINDYARVIRESGAKYYANLDVIGDYKATAKNQAYLESLGLHPIATFHFNSPIEELEKMLDKYDYIALGGLVPLAMQKDKLIKWLDYCYSRITKRDKLVKTHLFGMNSLDIWKRYPCYSADATSWVSGSKFRRIIEFNGKRFVTHHKRLKTDKSHKVWEGNYIDLNLHNILEYQKGADYITKLWESRGIKWN